MSPCAPAALLAAPLFVTSLCLPFTATAQSSRSIVTVAVAPYGTTTPAQGEMYWIDHDTLTKTKIATPTLLDTDLPNCILMTSSTAGLIGTNPVNATKTGNIYSFTLGTSGVVLGNSGKPLNTSATAGTNIAQMVIVGSGTSATLYFVSQTGSAVGALQSMPLAGGSVTQVYDLTKLPSSHLVNALTEFAGKLYIGTWPVTAAAGGELISYDLSTGKAAKLLDLPYSKYAGASGTATIGFGCVSMQMVVPRLAITVVGTYGDKLEYNPLTAKVVSHTFHGPRTSPYVRANSVNSAFYDPTTNDWVIGTRSGSIERWVEEGTAANIVTGIGSHPAATGNSITGIHHFPDPKNSDKNYGPGCPLASSGMTPTDVSGTIVPGNANFAMRLWNAPASQNFVLALAVNQRNTNFGNAGCKLLLNPLVLLWGKTTATGTVTIPVALAANLPKNVPVHRQWGCTDGLGGFVLSNARTTTIQ